MNERKNEDRDELAWQAFQYVAGDFSADEAERFEERLATDQAAREAVAEAVELLHAVCAAEATEPMVAVAARPTTWSKQVVWTVAGTAAAVAIVVGSLTVNLWTGSSRSNERNVAVSPALADAWSAVRNEYASDETATQSVAASAILTEAELAIAEEDLALSTEAPSWMTAGVLSLSGKSLDAGESVPQEN